jgi:uncharacterized membrane protein YhaH (DUF805 family)
MMRGPLMNFGQAIQAGFRHYLNFAGRARRSEYWYWMLFATLVQLAADLLSGSGESLASLVVTLIVLLPSLAIGVRRLHDIDKSGWFLLLWFIPLIGWVVLIVWACRPGTAGPNRFGADPFEMPPAVADTPAV